MKQRNPIVRHLATAFAVMFVLLSFGAALPHHHHSGDATAGTAATSSPQQDRIVYAPGAKHGAPDLCLLCIVRSAERAVPADAQSSVEASSPSIFPAADPVEPFVAATAIPPPGRAPPTVFS
jgi:hypothetical protein